MQPKFVIVDTETTGLDPDTNIMLEIAIQIYTARLELIAEWSRCIVSPLVMDHLEWLKNQDDKYVWNMHQENNLTNEIGLLHANGNILDHRDIEVQAVSFMKDHGLGENHIMLPMCGSSILFDRKFIAKQMPELDKQFHYRNMDVSSMKEFCKVWRPELITEYAEQNKDFSPAHRSLADCNATRNELAFYAENLFIE